MLSLDNLSSLVSSLNDNGHTLTLDGQQKKALLDLLNRVLNPKDAQLLEVTINQLREEIKDALKADDAIKTEAKNELKTEELKVEAKGELKTNQAIITEAKNDLKADQTIIDQVKDQLAQEIKQKAGDFERINQENQVLKTQKSAAEANVITLTQKNTKLEAEKNAFNTKVQQLEKEKTDLKNQLAEAEKKNKELEAKKQSTEQSKAPVYTATVGVGLAAGLLLAAVLGHTTKLPMLAIVGVAAASVLVAGGITYYALKPSTKVDETQEPKQTTVIRL